MGMHVWVCRHLPAPLALLQRPAQCTRHGNTPTHVAAYLELGKAQNWVVVRSSSECDWAWGQPRVGALVWGHTLTTTTSNIASLLVVLNSLIEECHGAVIHYRAGTGVRV